MSKDLTPDEQRDRDDWGVLDLLIHAKDQRPWTAEEITRELGPQFDVVDAIDSLYGAGLVHRTSDGFVFASRAALRFHELKESRG